MILSGIDNKSTITWLFSTVLIAILITGCASEKANLQDTDEMRIASSETSIQSPEQSPTLVPASLTNTVVPPTATPTHIPSDTFTPAPTLTPTFEPTPSPTPYLIPTLERVLSLQNPEMNGDDVLQLQTWLQSLGYVEVGSPDGIFGGMTDQAVRRFQGDQSLEVDGYVGESTWTRLFILLKVEAIENRLRELGYGICNGNKVYSEQTAAAVAGFQEQNGLEPDGEVNLETWTRLFSGKAVSISHGESLNVTPLAEVEEGGRLAFDGEYLWLVGAESLLKIDPDSGSVINTVPFPDLGQIKDSFGVVYPKTFSADEALVHEGQLWVSGEVLTYPNLSASAVLVFDPLQGGELIRGPIFLSSNSDSLVWAPVLFEKGGKVWAGLDAHPNESLFEINPLNYQVGRSLLLGRVEALYDVESDGETTWISLVLEGDRTLRTLNLNNGRLGPPLAVCGYELVYDGNWLWVEKGSTVFALDPATSEIVSHARVGGSAHSMAANGEGTLWVLVSKSNDWYLQVIVSQ
jgi:peptidoglycan hydrolase-like protein with peptidoglycan-binding domain